jgi:hypothetical protein
MAKKPKTQPLRIVSDLDEVTGPQPSCSLGECGLKLWNSITAEYDVSDSSGIELLTQACLASDRAAALAAHVAQDGEIVRTPTGIKVHPAVKEELACRGFVVRTLQKLGLNYEPLRSTPGRPPS